MCVFHFYVFLITRRCQVQLQDLPLQHLPLTHLEFSVTAKQTLLPTTRFPSTLKSLILELVEVASLARLGLDPLVLEACCIAGSDVLTDAGILDFGAVRLRKLHVENCRLVTAAVVTALLPLAPLTSLNIAGCNARMAFPPPLATLRELRVNDSPLVIDIARLAPDLTSLAYKRTQYDPQYVSDVDGLAAIAQRGQLRELVVTLNPPHALPDVSPCRALRTLILTNAQLDVRPLAACTEMEVLIINDKQKVPGAALAVAVAAMPRLRVLSVRCSDADELFAIAPRRYVRVLKLGSSVTDTGLARVAAVFPGVQHLDVSGSVVTSAGVARLAEARCLAVLFAVMCTQLREIALPGVAVTR